MRRIVLTLGALALVASACSSSISEEEFIEQLVEDGGATQEQAQCVVDGLNAADIPLDSVTDQALGDDDIPAEAGEVVTNCILESFGLDSDDVDIDSLSEGPQAYGDDADLDALYDSCEGGDYAACDTLYFQSPIGSEYEAFGNTCGQRVDFAVSCADELGG